MILAVCMLSSLSLAQDTKEAQPIQGADLTKSLQAKKQEPAPTNDGSLEQKASYVLGYSAVMRLLQQVGPQGMEVDNEFFLSGATAALKGVDSKIGQEETEAVMKALQKKLTERMVAKMDEAKVKGAKFLADNAKKEGVKMLGKGVQYKVIKTGTSTVKPKASDVVSILYKGTLMDGTIFDQTKGGKPLDRLKAGQFVPGFAAAVQAMTVGSKWKIFIPGDQGYGPRGSGTKIGPNETLVFEVELLGIK